MSTVRIQVKVPAEWAGELARRAKQSGSTVSEEVRRLLAGTFGDPVPKDVDIVKVTAAVMPEAKQEKGKLMSALPYPHEHPCFLTGEEKHRQCLRCCICGKK